VRFEATASWGSTRVTIRLDNGALWWTLGPQIESRPSGAEPPLTADQLRQIVSDPATNIRAAASCQTP
jgi:hypothetical protein